MATKSTLIPVQSAVSGSSLELLLDLVEIKLGCVEVYDRDDARELKALEKARKELCSLLGRPTPEGFQLVPMRAPRTDRRAPSSLHA